MSHLATASLTLAVIDALASVVTFAFYGVDKQHARSKKCRVPENTLHLLSVAGGWPGALLAQQAFRHKTRKVSFRIVFWLTVLLNGVATSTLIWLTR